MEREEIWICGDIVKSHNDQTGLKQHYFEERMDKEG